MKRFSFTKLTVACAFLFAPLAASAQIETATGRSAFVDKLVLELGVGAGTSHDDVRPMELFANAGYRFIPRMYVFAHAGGMFGLGEKTGGTRAYTRLLCWAADWATHFAVATAWPWTCAARRHRVWARPTGKAWLTTPVCFCV